MNLRLYAAALALGASLGAHAATEDAPLAYDAIAAEVHSLKQDEVAWRKIEWRTCLIDGLRESRERKKPVMLWIFIDRPVDDERC